MEETDLVAVRARARVGTLLNGKWHLDKLVGVGGMAAVYAATHRNSKRVAIKILHPEISVDENARQRFLREGYAANQVGHRGAVAADDDGLTEDGVAFLVMELLEGETLDERSVRQAGRLEAREVLALMDQTLSTLEAAHDKGIVHRDLKPENLFLTRDGLVKVLDFGIARLQESAGSPSQTRGVMGTPSFMAPEQARGRWTDVDARTDLWAIGATMFTVLSGRFVHEAETVNEALVMAVTARAPSLATVVVGVHPALAALVDKSLAYERESRFQTAREFHDALRAVHVALAGDESLPALAVPAISPLGSFAPKVSLAQPRALGLTTGGGVAASVRTAPTQLDTAAKSRSKLVLASLALGAIGVVALAIPRFVGGSAKRAQYTEPAAAANAEIALKAEAPAGMASPINAANAANASPETDRVAVRPTPDAPTKLTHAKASRAASSASKPSVVSAKPRTIPPKIDPFLKRH